jgi:hypothetical protein
LKEAICEKQKLHVPDLVFAKSYSSQDHKSLSI